MNAPIRPGPFRTPWPSDLNTPEWPRLGNLRRVPGARAVPGGVVIPETAVMTYGLERLLRQFNSLEFDVGTSSVKLLDEATTFRNGLMMRNTSGDLAVPTAAIVRINFDAPATLRSVLRLDVDEIMFFDYGIPQGEVYAIADVAGAVSIAQSAITLPE